MARTCLTCAYTLRRHGERLFFPCASLVGDGDSSRMSPSVAASRDAALTSGGRASLPGHRPRCVDGPPTGDPHDVTGPHRERCREHLGDYTRWRKARDTYVRRLAAKAAQLGQDFDADGARRDREQRKPYRPITRSDRARGAMPLDPGQVRSLRATVGALLEAKQPIDGAHRSGDEIPGRELARLLLAIEQHAMLVARLLAEVRR